MGSYTGIEWCKRTGNIWWGCEEVHEGCDNCYARILDNRWNGNHWGADRPRRAIKSIWKDFMRWQLEAQASKEIHRVFVGSMMDIAEKPMPLVDIKGNKLEGTTGDLRKKYFNEIVPLTPNLLHLMLSKRPSAFNKYIPDDWKFYPPKNIMFGTSPVNQPTADNLISHLLKVKGRRFLSIEPQLGFVDLEKLYGNQTIPLEGIDWVIVGGESGHHKRPFNPDWARAIRDTCKKYDTPFFMKQWDKIKEIPVDLMIREFPLHYKI